MEKKTSIYAYLFILEASTRFALEKGQKDRTFYLMFMFCFYTAFLGRCSSLLQGSLSHRNTELAKFGDVGILFLLPDSYFSLQHLRNGTCGTA